MSTPLAEAEDDVFDLTEAVPETQRLDNSLQKAKAQLSIKTRRHRPSRSRLRDSLSSTEGEDSLDGKSTGGTLPSSCSPLHTSLCSTDLHLPSCPTWRDRTFTLDAQDRTVGRYRHLQSTSSQEALLPATSVTSAQHGTRSENSSPAHLRQGDRLHLHEEDRLQLHQRDHLQLREEDRLQGNRSLLRQRDHSQSEDDSHELASDEPSSPTVLLDKKTRRSFLNLGVTLRRTYGKVRKDRSNRLSAGNREMERTDTHSSRSSGPPFVPFSWFSDRLRSSSSPKVSSQSTAKMFTKGSSQEEESKPSAGLLEVSEKPVRPERSQPYRSLDDRLGKEEEGEDPAGAAPVCTKKKSILPFSAGGRDRGGKQNGVYGKSDGGQEDEGQKLLTT